MDVSFYGLESLIAIFGDKQNIKLIKSELLNIAQNGNVHLKRIILDNISNGKITEKNLIKKIKMICNNDLNYVVRDKSFEI